MRRFEQAGADSGLSLRRHWHRAYTLTPSTFTPLLSSCFGLRNGSAVPIMPV
jgi:hypothetical protein